MRARGHHGPVCNVTTVASDRGRAAAAGTGSGARERPAAGAALRLTGLALLAATAATVLTGCQNSADPTQRGTTSYSVAGHVRMLVVSTHVGDVRVTGGATVAISVTQHVAFHGAAPTVSRRFADGTLSLSSHCAPDSACSVSYDITVPRATAVRVTDDVGTVRLSGLAGPVTVTVEAGGIDLSSLSGPLNATTRAGTITGRDLSSPRASLLVSAGAIDLEFSAPPSAFAATTGIGAVILHVPNTVPYRVTATATVGHIGIGVTQDTAAARTITISTKVGAITISGSP